MRLFRRKRGKHVRGLARVASVGPEFPNSPFGADKISPGDPGWAIFEAAIRSGGPVVGVYDSETGEVVSIRSLSDEPEQPE